MLLTALNCRFDDKGIHSLLIERIEKPCLPTSPIAYRNLTTGRETCLYETCTVLSTKLAIGVAVSVRRILSVVFNTARWQRINLFRRQPTMNRMRQSDWMIGTGQVFRQTALKLLHGRRPMTSTPHTWHIMSNSNRRRTDEVTGIYKMFIVSFCCCCCILHKRSSIVNFTSADCKR